MRVSKRSETPGETAFLHVPSSREGPELARACWLAAGEHGHRARTGGDGARAAERAAGDDSRMFRTQAEPSEGREGKGRGGREAGEEQHAAHHP